MALLSDVVALQGWILSLGASTGPFLMASFSIRGYIILHVYTQSVCAMLSSHCSAEHVVLR